MQNVCNVRGVAARVFFAKFFVEMCVKVRKCENSHVRTPALVRNVCNVCGVVAGGFFAKFFCGNVCESAEVRNFARPHTHTRAKCVQRAWCGCGSFFLQNFFVEMCAKVRKCEISHVRTPARVRNVFNV